MEFRAKIQSTARKLKTRFLVHSSKYPWLQTGLIVIASALLFGAAFKLGVNTFIGDSLSVCWPLVGIEAAVLLRFPRRYWPAMIAGMGISQLLVDGRPTIEQIAVETASDIVEVVLAALMSPRR